MVAQILNCPIHNTAIVLVCNEYRCGLCYEKELLEADIKSFRPPTGSIISIYSEDKHRMVMKKA